MGLIHRKKVKRIKLWQWIVIVILSLALSAELIARFALGLGHPLLYEASNDYGYRVVPNQDIYRFGNRLFYNAEGLRSQPIQTYPPLDTIRILCVGDSITYGGVQTDQVKTYPYLLQDLLNQSTGKHFEVLNASAGSWAIGNEEAYLEHFGTYNSQIVLLQLGTNDLFQTKSSSDLVGRHPSYPNRNPILALEDVLFRYLVPKQDLGVEISAPSTQDLQHNLELLLQLNKFVQSRKAKLMVFFIEQPDEFEPQGELYQTAKQMLRENLKVINVPFISIAENMRRGGGRKLFRDTIHPNPEGNAIIARVLAEMITQQLHLNPPKS